MSFSRFSAALVALAAFASSGGVHAVRQPLPIAEVVKLSKSGASPEQVIARIKGSATTFALRGSDFPKLKAAGVSDPVLDYLQQSFVDELDLQVGALGD